MAASIFTSSKFLLALGAGASAAAVGGGYVIKDDQGRPIIQSLLSTDQADPKSETAPIAESVEPEEQDQTELAKLPEDVGGPQQEEPVAENATQPPTFDLLRVERDGSVVVAGRAPANSTVEIIANDTPLASGKAGPGGDFAIVFDEPLAPGAHELTIRATPPAKDDGKSVAVLSTETGIVNVPDKADAEGEVLAMVQQPGAATRVLQKPEELSASQPEAETEVAATGAQETDETAPEETAADEAAGEDALPDETALAARETSGPVEVEEEVNPPVEEQIEEEVASTQALAEAEIGEVPPTADKAEAESEPQAGEVDNAVLSVQAVDVEPEKVFIAGSGEPGARVQVYIDNTFRGTTTVGPEGGFLFEMPQALASGEYNLRIDEVDNSGVVKSRVAVVIEHQVEKTVAAADTESAPVEPVQEEAPTPVQATSIEETGEENHTESPVQTAGVQPETVTGKSEDDTPEAENDSIAESATETVELVQQDETVADEGEAVMVQPQAEPASKVIRTGTSVIIRRGDSLWRISRRMLGQGRKYTMIFEANANQIQDPDLIFPGQVFDVPDQAEADGDGEQG